MPEYKAPLRDIRFVRDELLGYEDIDSKIQFRIQQRGVNSSIELQQGSICCRLLDSDWEQDWM